jgi:excisionase family DNA binding protein
MQETLDFRDPEWVAEKLNLDKNAVYRYLNDGLLPGMQLGRKWLISESNLAEFLKAEQRRQTQERRLASESHGFTLWSDRTQRSLEMARDEALGRNHNYIGTEHILLALAAEPGNSALAVLTRIGVDPNDLVAELNRVVPAGTDAVHGAIGLTPRARKAIELATAEAERLNHSQIGCEHLLLGLVAENDGVAAGVLKGLGVSIESARAHAAALAQDQ